MSDTPAAPAITAYRIHGHETAPLSSAPIERDWMEGADQRYPYRCLPLNIANQNGWVVGCPAGFRAYWYGGSSPKDVEIRYDDRVDPLICSHFGLGVVTFSIPYLFRTPEGINLWVKGPSNSPKDGIHALEGIVETDWAVSTFTMNWKLTRPNEWVHFDEGEPICMLVPIPRGLTESLMATIEVLSEHPDLQERYDAWDKSRRGFLDGLKALDPEVVKRGWQKDYFQGKQPEGGTFRQHQTRLAVRDFTRGGRPG